MKRFMLILLCFLGVLTVLSLLAGLGHGGKPGGEGPTDTTTKAVSTTTARDPVTFEIPIERFIASAEGGIVGEGENRYFSLLFGVDNLISANVLPERTALYEIKITGDFLAAGRSTVRMYASSGDKPIFETNVDVGEGLECVLYAVLSRPNGGPYDSLMLCTGADEVKITSVTCTEIADVMLSSFAGSRQIYGAAAGQYTTGVMYIDGTDTSSAIKTDVYGLKAGDYELHIIGGGANRVFMTAMQNGVEISSSTYSPWGSTMGEVPPGDVLGHVGEVKTVSIPKDGDVTFIFRNDVGVIDESPERDILFHSVFLVKK